MKIKTRLQLSIILSLILTVTIGLFILFALQKMNTEVKEERTVTEIVKGMAELKSVAHEYLLHPTDRSLMQWNSTYDYLTKLLMKSANEFENPAEKIALGKILENIKRFKAAFSNVTTGFGKEQGLVRQESAIPQDLRDRLIGELLVKSQATVPPVFQLQQVIQTELIAAQKNSGLLIIIFILILVFLVTAISLWTNRSIARPIAELEKDIRIIGSGNLDHKVGTTAKDEIGQLSRAFDMMTGDLKESTASIVELNKEIGERKRAEEAFRESEAQKAAMLDGISTNLAFVNEDLEILWANKTSAESVNRNVDEIIGHKCYELWADPNAPCDDCPTAKAFQTKKTEQTIIHSPDGRVWEEKGEPIFDEKGGLLGVLEIAHDITAKARAEDALRDSEERYRLLVENQTDMIVKFDTDGHLTFVSQSYCKAFGKSEDELLGKKFIPLIHEEDREAVVKALDKVNRPPYIAHVEERAMTKDGWRWQGWLNTAVLNEKNEVEATVAVGRDINKQRQVEEERIKLEAKLLHAQKMEAIGTLAGGVAHDLNNILGGLVSYPELLLLKLPEDSPLRKSILTIQKSGEKAAAVVQDLLTLARRGIVITEVVNPNDIISEYLESLEHEKVKSYHPGIHIETHLEKEVLNILGSSIHLSKTVMNLVSNAAEAMPEGGLLTVSTENRYVDRSVRGYDDVKQGDYVVLTVSDTGTGIDPDDMEKIFEPFYTKKKMGRSGTGLGMAVVWGTVKDHNGYIDVQSTEGKGTTFTLYFPVTRKSVEERSEMSIKDYMGKGEAILVVDDVGEQRKTASGMLRELGYSVAMVSSGEEAVEYLKTNKADLLLLDMIMDPGIDGLDTYKRIIEIHHGQKAIIASGFSETDRVKELQSLGAGTYIRKPFLLEKIGLAVREELEK